MLARKVMFSDLRVRSSVCLSALTGEDVIPYKVKVSRSRSSQLSKAFFTVKEDFSGGI